MSDFCRKCTNETFGIDKSDMAGLVTKEQFKEGSASQGLCEGCRATFFDPEGKRVKPSDDNMSWVHY